MLSTLIGNCTYAEVDNIGYNVYVKQGQLNPIPIPCMVWHDGKKWHVVAYGNELEVYMAVAQISGIAAHLETEEKYQS